METNLLIKKLQKRLTEFKFSYDYSQSSIIQDINAVQIALCLFEMSLYCNRPIKEDEMYWFNGGYYIAYDIAGEWEDISKMYDEIVKIVKMGL